MPTIKKFEGEKYKCSNCDEIKSLREIWKTWVCPTCRQPIDILVEIEGKKYLVNRIAASNIRVSDLVIVGTSLPARVLHQVSESGGKVRLALEGFGVIKKKPTVWIDTVNRERRILVKSLTY